MRELGEQGDFNVFDAESGLACLEFIKHTRPDLLLLDLSMPGMDGRDLALHIRSGQYADIPIIFLTGNLVESDSRYVASLEDCPVIGKPVNLADLVKKIGISLGLEWIFAAQQPRTPCAQVEQHPPGSAASLPEAERIFLLSALNCGDLKSLRERLVMLRLSSPDMQETLTHLLTLASSYQLEILRHQLEQA